MNLHEIKTESNDTCVQQIEVIFNFKIKTFVRTGGLSFKGLTDAQHAKTFVILVEKSFLKQNVDLSKNINDSL